ncbi:MAG: Stp1/IreP family PP2C-type Ser/Thr phosphatase [Oscillospiraceae bacterium]|nr:Stp1/IreP family PP2C-type Ser/Thr phosphatase [Oscillospiraceae bacterium]
MTVFGLTDKGKVRTVNQDAYRFYEAPGGDACVLVLCDGMGGERAGEIASAAAADAFLDYAVRRFAEPEPPLAVDVAREAAAWANLQVYDRANRDENCRGMGTTLVAVVVSADDTVIVNVGDSRCYWLAEGQLLQVTRDHSLVQEMVDQGMISGDEARSHPRKNVITRAVGVERRIRTDVFRIDLRPGDKLLLCSDGLSNQVTEQEIADLLKRTKTPEATCETLVSLALQRGAPDNVTVLLLHR